MRCFALAGAVIGLGLLIGGCQEPGRVLGKLPDPTFCNPCNPPPVKGETPRVAAGTPTKPGLTQPPAEEPVRPESPAVKGDPAWERHVPDHTWRYIVVHHSASPRGNAASFDLAHREKGWDELGYHFVIGNGSLSGDGQIEVGPRWTKQKHGAHCKTSDNRFNDDGIGICLVGNFDRGYPSAAQMASLRRLIAYLSARYRISADHIYGHRQAVATMHERGTECPGTHLDLAVVRGFAAGSSRVTLGSDYGR